MSRPFIVIGDRTDHGGVVVGSSQTTDTHGKRIARVGDQVTCPKKGHGGTTVIVSGDPTMIIDGQPAARHGDKCACGATLISGQAVSSVGTGGPAANRAASTGANMTLAESEQSIALKPPGDQPAKSNQNEEDLEHYFVAVRTDGKPVSLAYRVDGDKGKLHEGVLNQRGETKALPMSQAVTPIFWTSPA